jgi:alkyl hydroperoxide reductase subunit AhpF
MTRTIEVFSAGCPLCRETIKNVKQAVEEKGCGCEVVERKCEGDTCCEPAQKQNIKAVPTIVRDGEILHVGKASVEEIKEML